MFALLAFFPYYVGYTYVFGQALYFGITMAELSLGQFEYYVASISAFKAIIELVVVELGKYTVAFAAIFLLIVMVVVALRIPHEFNRWLIRAVRRSSVRRSIRKARKAFGALQLLALGAVLFFSAPLLRDLGEKSARRLTASLVGGLYQPTPPAGCTGTGQCGQPVVLDYSRDTLLYANADEYFILRQMDGRRVSLIRLRKAVAPITIDSLYRTRILGAF